MSGLYVGVDLGGTNMRAAVVDSSGRLASEVKKERTPTAEGEKAVMEALKGLVRRVLDVAPGPVRAVGIGAPGPLDSRTGRILYTPNLPFRDYPVAPEVEAELGIPVFLENDANSACWGEFWVGAGKAFSDMVILTLGTGVGGGIILDGRLHRGVDEMAGHLGHIVVEPGGRPCGCGGRGCLEQYASATAVVRRARELMREQGVDAPPGKPAGELTGKDVVEAAEAGFEPCAEALREAAEAMGWALVTIANVIDPEAAVIGGGLAGAGDLLLAPAEKILRENAMAPPRDNMRLALAALGDAAGIIGAAGCAKTRYATSA